MQHAVLVSILLDGCCYQVAMGSLDNVIVRVFLKFGSLGESVIHLSIFVRQPVYSKQASGPTRIHPHHRDQKIGIPRDS
jgi:hypothetical protein